LDKDLESVKKNLLGVICMNYGYKVAWVLVLPGLVRCYFIRNLEKLKGLYPGGEHEEYI
jgi:hypothetical protein